MLQVHKRLWLCCERRSEARSADKTGFRFAENRTNPLSYALQCAPSRNSARALPETLLFLVRYPG